MRGLLTSAPEWKSALAFTLALVVFEGVALHLGYGPYLVGRTIARSSLPLRVGLILFGVAVTMAFVWTSLTAHWRARAVYIVIFALAVFLEYGYANALQGFATADDLLVAFWGSTFSVQKGMATAYVSWLAIIPCLAYVGLLIGRRPSRGTGWATLFTLLLGLFVANLGVVSLLSFDGFQHYRGYPTTSFGGFVRSWTEVAAWAVRVHLLRPREAVAAVAGHTPANNIVFIVDESVRADHLSMNGYGRPTTPTLDALNRSGDLTNWGIAVSGANCSAAANRLLWVGYPPADLPARGKQIWTWANIAQYARSLGYRTTYVDGHRAFWLADTLDLRDIDRWLAREHFHQAADMDVDFAIADWLAETLDAATGNFIWVNKAGVHTPYDLVYPDREKVWTPVQGEFASGDGASRAALINSYDNAIRYNVDGFFRRLDMTRRRPGTTLVYTSDHGQSLHEQGESWNHCSDQRAGALNRDREAMVPLFMIVAGEKARDVSAAFNRASHANVFATLLDLMGVPGASRRHGYAPTLLGVDHVAFGPRSYFLSDAIEGGPFGVLARFDERRLLPSGSP